MDKPIMVRCVGSGAEGHDVAAGCLFICPMCGQDFDDSPLPAHDRQDILAMIERGDGV
jgi:hypothetical protein